jgi:hypothetical protein
MGYKIFCLTPQDIQEQEAVILRAMLRPEKLLHFLRPGRLVSRCRAVCFSLMAPNTVMTVSRQPRSARNARSTPARVLKHVTTRALIFSA